MPYAPGIQNRAGELLARGIEQGGEAISEAIENYGRKRDELKGYRQVALAMGLPSEEVDKMSLGDIKGKIMANEITTQRQQQAQRQRAAAAMQPFIQAFRENMTPKLNPRMPALGDTYTSIASGDVQGTVTPGEAGPAAALDALAANPDVMGAPAGADAFTAALKGSMTTPKQQPRVLDIGGTKILWNPDTGRERQVVPLRAAAGAPGGGAARMTEQERQAWPEIDYETEAWEQDKTRSGTPIPGRFISVDRKTGKYTGKVAYDPQNAPRPGAAKTDLFDDSPGGGREPSALPKITSKMDFDALESGAQYIGKDGQTYQKP